MLDVPEPRGARGIIDSERSYSARSSCRRPHLLEDQPHRDAVPDPHSASKGSHRWANRLTQIATRTGDDGTTGLGDNTRVSKDSLRVHAMGDVDELNSHIGVLLCEELPPGVRALLVEIQHQLFNLGGELSIPGFELLKAEAVLALDEALATHNEQLPRLQEFILPAGNRAAAQAHVCRTVARRAERALVALGARRAAARRRRAST